MDYLQAEWYDPLALHYWQVMEPELRRALEPWRGATGLAVDIGAGTGSSTAIVADICAGEVLACEPESAMRVGAMTRCADCDDWRARVTIMPWSVEDVVAQLDEPVCLVTAITMLDHLPPATRAALFQWAASHLTPDGALVVGPYGWSDAADDPGQEVTDPELGHRFASCSVGRIRYSGWSRYDATGAQPTWHMTWQAHLGDHLLDDRRADFLVFPATAEQVIQEAESAGLKVKDAGTFLTLAPAGKSSVLQA